MPPTLGNGKICYVVLPASNVDESASFYANVFGWQVRRRGDGQLAFDDGVGEVSGTWVTTRQPTTELGLLFYIMVDDAAATVERLAEAGAEITQPIGADAPEITALFRDPGGNIVGVYQQPG
jgi:predicted enzyme related to lactoylglutathione lyase